MNFNFGIVFIRTLIEHISQYGKKEQKIWTRVTIYIVMFVQISIAIRLSKLTFVCSLKSTTDENYWCNRNNWIFWMNNFRLSEEFLITSNELTGGIIYIDLWSNRHMQRKKKNLLNLGSNLCFNRSCIVHIFCLRFYPFSQHHGKYL